MRNLSIHAARWTHVAVFTVCAFTAVLALMIGLASGETPAQAALPNDSTHLGVASCSGSTCHGRSEADGKIVRQDEIMRWQEASSPTGSHSRAFAILSEPRSRQIADRIPGLGDPTKAERCLGCHVDNAASRGPRFQLSDGLGCEACHGGAQNWIEVHKLGNHANNVRAGMIPLNQPKARASVCLDCHFGSADGGQFVDHEIMAAGHPRVSFELDLFSTLQQHHNEDVDYARRKGLTSNVKVWAVGQAMAVERALSLYANPKFGQDGGFPEFYFFDCHSCHRQIYDKQSFNPTALLNPGRPIKAGAPPFNDENMIMLLAAARVAAPGMAAKFDADSKAFHRAVASDRNAAVAAAGRLRASAASLASTFQAAEFSRGQVFAIIDMIGSEAISPRFTDYEGSVQAVMAVDTLLNALVNGNMINGGAATAIRGEINRAYGAVHDPNDYQPGEFRRALGSAVRTIRTLR